MAVIRREDREGRHRHHTREKVRVGASMMKWMERFSAFINKDVENPNESKKTAVMTRCICSVMIVYFIGQTIFVLFHGYYRFVLFPAGILVIYGFAFYLTYSSRTTLAYYLLILLTLGWCFISTDLYGWNTGAQYGYCTILVYIFNGTKPLKRKLIDGLVLLVVGFMTFMFAITGKPVYVMSLSQIVVQESLNMLSTLVNLALITTIFAHGTLDAERKLMDYNREMTHQAETDALTGLMNRRAGEKYFEEIHRRSLQEGFFVNVVMGDIDFFKQVNDTYGHDAGDEVLKVLAARFMEFMEGKGAVARWGGEEFLFVLINMNGDMAYFEMEKLCQSIRKLTIHAGEEELQVTMTFGIEECGRDQSMEDALEAADRKLYMGKARGRNQVVM